MDWLTWTYQADAPYLFVICAGEDADSVQQEIKWLHDQEFNVRCDIDIHSDDAWTRGLPEAIEQAALVLSFVSPGSPSSAEFRQIINHVAECKTPSLDIHLLEAQSESGSETASGKDTPILKYARADDEYRRDLLAALMARVPDTRIQPITTPAMPVMDEKGTPNLVQHGLIALVILVLGILAYIVMDP